MKTTIRTHTGRSLALVLALWVMIGSAAMPSMASAQAGTDADIQAVTQTVNQLARAEAQRDINTLYDLMVPEARVEVPRQALVAWYAQDSTFIATGDPVVESVAFGEWVYPVTGQRYRNVATVTYTQPGEADGVAEDRELVMHLWNDGQSWRWFFGTEATSEEEIAGFAEPDVAYESPYRTEAFRQIDTFWAQVFANAGIEYEAPVDMIGVHVQPIKTGCGLEEDIETMAVYYCTLDETIYFDPGFRDIFLNGEDDYMWTSIIAHEWGHHIQNELGIYATYEPELDGGLYSIELELQADCLAGLYAQDALARGLITEDDVQAAAQVTDEAGDLSGTSWDDDMAHGSGEQREQSFWTGFDDGLRGCNVDLASYGGH